MTKQAYQENQVRPKWLLTFGSNAHTTTHDLKEIPAWNYIQKHCFKGNTVLELPEETLFNENTSLALHPETVLLKEAGVWN